LRYHYATPASCGLLARAGRYSQAGTKGKEPMGPRSQAKRDKLAAALRENLKRRKAYARALQNKPKGEDAAAKVCPNTAIKNDLT
jgi:hypothetical protein